jgi:hypothetical protein
MKMISRRNLLKTAGAVAAAESLNSSGLPAMAQAAGNGSAKPRTLVLMGDAAHNSDVIRVSLDRLFKELDLPVDYTTNYYDLSASLLKPYQIFIAFRDSRDAMIQPGTFGDRGPQPPTEAAPPSGFAGGGGRGAGGGRGGGGFASWITEEQGAAVKDFVNAGNGLYALHNSCDMSTGSKNFRDVMGGLYNGHPALRPFKVRVVNKEHPITQGVEDFMVTDEQHFPVYDKDPKYLLLRGENVDGLTYRHLAGPGAGAGEIEDTVSNSGWAYEYGKGRVVFTAMGHTIHTMWEPQHLKLQKNAVNWLLKKI